MNLVSVNCAAKGVGSALVNPEHVMFLSERIGSPNVTLIHLADPGIATSEYGGSLRMVVMSDTARAVLFQALGPLMPVTLRGSRADRGAIIHVRRSSIVGVLPLRIDGPGPMGLHLSDGRKINIFDVDELKSLVAG